MEYSCGIARQGISSEYHAQNDSVSTTIFSCCFCLHVAIIANKSSAHYFIYCCSVRIDIDIPIFLNIDILTRVKLQNRNIRNYLLWSKLSCYVDFMYGHSDVHA